MSALAELTTISFACHCLWICPAYRRLLHKLHPCDYTSLPSPPTPWPKTTRPAPGGRCSPPRDCPCPASRPAPRPICRCSRKAQIQTPQQQLPPFGAGPRLQRSPHRRQCPRRLQNYRPMRRNPTSCRGGRDFGPAAVLRQKARPLRSAQSLRMTPRRPRRRGSASRFSR